MRKTTGQKTIRLLAIGLFLAGCGDKPELQVAEFPPEDVSRPSYQGPALTSEPVDLQVCSLHIDHDCGVEEQMVPVIPSITEIRLPVECALKIKVLADGSAQALSTVCSDPRFDASVTEAASTIRYKTHDVCGNICPTIGREFEYPVTFASE